jgi:L,D-peptidoglycan transpeptidase YkuD (ErfK/YbiS/YcfS/YnhG family)
VLLGTAAGAAVAALTGVLLPAAFGAPPGAGAASGLPLPLRLADTGGGSQLIIATAGSASATTGTLSWWQKTGGVWRKRGSTSARFGAHGLVAGTKRKQNTSTTPAGLYDLPFAFGNAAAPKGTKVSYRHATSASWWCEDVASTSYNRWVQGLPKDCRASESERIADYPTQYAHAFVIGFNYAKPVKGRGAGIFLHIYGSGATAGCVSVPASAMGSLLGWVDPAHHPHIAIGTASGSLAVTRY